MEKINIDLTQNPSRIQLESTIHSYNNKIEDFLIFCEELKEEESALTEKLNMDVESIDAEVQSALQVVLETSERESLKEVDLANRLLAEIDHFESLLDEKGIWSAEKLATISELKKAIKIAYEARNREIKELYQFNKEQLEKGPQETKDILIEQFDQEKELVLEKLQQYMQGLAEEEEGNFDQYYETTADPTLLSDTPTISKQPLSYLNIGQTIYTPELFGDLTSFPVNHFVSFFHRKNLFLINAPQNVEETVRVVNAIIGRSLMSYLPKQMELHLIDPVNKGRNFRKFSKLSPDIKSVYTQEKEIDKLFKQLDKTITKNFQTFLKDEYNDLGEYNEANGLQEIYRLVVIMNYPKKFSKKTIKRLKGVVANGPIAGINLVLISNKDYAWADAENKKVVPSQLIRDFLPFCQIIDLENSTINGRTKAGPIHFFNDEDIDLRGIIHYVNGEMEEEK